MTSIIDWEKSGDIGVSRRPKRYDIEIYQGDSFEVVLKFRDGSNVAIDLTGVTASGKFVKTATGTVPPAQPTVTVDGPAGTITVLISDTSLFQGDYLWDLQLTQGGKKRTYIGGKVSVVTDITPDA